MAKKKNPKDKMVFLGITIDQPLLERLNRYAKIQEISVSLTIRQALKKFLPVEYYNDSDGILREGK